MSPQEFLSQFQKHKPSIPLQNGSRVAVIGGGPAGSFFSYFLLDLANRMDLELRVDIYEPRDFSLPAPQGCNMCAGVVSETLIQNLATEGINFPSHIIQKAINSYILHTDFGSQRIDSKFLEKTIGVVFRGAGPHKNQNIKISSFDSYLLSMAEDKGANVIHTRVAGVERSGENLQVKTRNDCSEKYDFLVVATGVNSSAYKIFEEEIPEYSPPETTKTAIREYFIGSDAVETAFGYSLHIFLLNIPRLDFAFVIPKGEFVSVCLLGKDIDDQLLQAFLAAPEVKNLFPDGWHPDQPSCQCMPRISIHPAMKPYSDRVVFIGDSGVTRVYKDGIGAAYRAAKAAATCAIFEGISSVDFDKYYASFCRKMEFDNKFGRFIFSVTRVIQSMKFSQKALIRMMRAEQLNPEGPQRMSGVLWDAFTGSAPYLNVFLRILHPTFLSLFILSLATSITGG